MHKIKSYILNPLVLVGALNWGLIGFFGFDLVTYIFGPGTFLTHIVYKVVGLAAVACILIMMIPDERK